MQLEHMTWQEVETYLKHDDRALIGTGSIEQHGPIGLIGTDAICASGIAQAAAERAGVIVAPALHYAPASFNTGFPGTLSVSEQIFEHLAAEVFAGLAAQGLNRIFVVNGHGANIAPLTRAAEKAVHGQIHIRNWWDHKDVQIMRRDLYGDWEGMHATPSEVAMTQHLTNIINKGAETPPERLSQEYIQAHSGDRHGPPHEHRARFPDGRVGSHSALAAPEDGERLFEAAVAAVAAELGSSPRH